MANSHLLQSCALEMTGSVGRTCVTEFTCGMRDKTSVLPWFIPFQYLIIIGRCCKVRAQCARHADVLVWLKMCCNTAWSMINLNG